MFCSMLERTRKSGESDTHSNIAKELRALDDEKKRLGMSMTQKLDSIRIDVLNAVQKLETKSDLHSTTVQDLLIPSSNPNHWKELTWNGYQRACFSSLRGFVIWD